MAECDICQMCDGSGLRNPISGEKCFECNGTGIVEIVDEEWDDDDPYFYEDE